MKKAFLLILAAVICISIPSCDKSKADPTPTPTPTPVTQKSIDFIIAISPSQSDIIDQQFKIDVNGKTVTFKESEMTQVVDTTVKSFKQEVERIVYKEFKTGTVRYYKYNLGKLTAGQKVTGVSRTALIKSNRPSSETFDYLNAFYITVDGKNDPTFLNEVGLHKGIGNTDEIIKQFFEKLFKTFPLNYTCR